VSEPELVAVLRAGGCVFAEEEATILEGTARDSVELARMVEQRLGGVPLEQVVGWAEFCGVRVHLQPGVFVPRRRTVLLVHQAARLLPERGVAVDLCCGSGAVALALARTGVEVEIHAVDVDPAAVACARRNLDGVGIVYQGDLYAPLPATLRGRLDLVVANVPYVPSGGIDLLPREARLFEPRAALDGGDDGLDVVRALAAGALVWLAPKGHLLVEVDEAQAIEAERIFAVAGLRPRRATSTGLSATVVVGGA